MTTIRQAFALCFFLLLCASCLILLPGIQDDHAGTAAQAWFKDRTQGYHSLYSWKRYGSLLDQTDATRARYWGCLWFCILIWVPWIIRFFLIFTLLWRRSSFVSIVLVYVSLVIEYATLFIVFIYISPTFDDFTMVFGGPLSVWLICVLIISALARAMAELSDRFDESAT